MAVSLEAKERFDPMTTGSHTSVNDAYVPRFLDRCTGDLRRQWISERERHPLELDSRSAYSARTQSDVVRDDLNLFPALTV